MLSWVLNLGFAASPAVDFGPTHMEQVALACPGFSAVGVAAPDMASLGLVIAELGSVAQSCTSMRDFDLAIPTLGDLDLDTGE